MATLEIREEFLDWLKGGHMQALIDAGAESGEICLVESDSTDSYRVEVHYVFPDRATLQAYFDGPALVLRVDGKVRFVDTNKVVFGRSVASINYTL